MKLNAMLMVALVGAACLSLPALAQVPYDLSKAVEYKTVWQMDLGGSASILKFTKDFGGRAGLDVVTFGRTTWLTRPKLEMTNVFDWLNINNASYLQPIDYDGVQPNEYVNGLCRIWRCHSTEWPFPLVPIDTVPVDYIDKNPCAGTPSLSADIDGDGYLDVLTTGPMARIIRGGPMAGKGCERVLKVPPYRSMGDNPKDDYTIYDFFQSATGEWRMLQLERENIEKDRWESPFLRLYGLGFVRDTGGLHVTYRPLGEYKGFGNEEGNGHSFGGTMVLVDTAAGKDWLILNHDITPGKAVVSRFDITDGNFTSVEQVTGVWLESGSPNLGYELGTDRPVFVGTGLLADGRYGQLLFYADNLRQPTGWLHQPGGFASWAVINDQTGDGKPDILMSNWPSPSGAIRLMSGDTSLTSATEQTDSSGYSARLSGHELLVTVAAPCSVSAELVTIDGRAAGTVPAVQAQAGLTRLSLVPLLDSVAPGMYVLLVRLGEQMVTISLLK